MIRAPLGQVASVVEGEPGGLNPELSIRRVSIDSREIEPGDLFVAVRGERFDGHDFVPQALDRGALACVVSRPIDGRAQSLITVDDTVAALARLASWHRQRTTATVIAVTGSNGKTTTKNMIHHILGAQLKGKAAVKSFNNHLGVPLTLLTAEVDDDYLVVEVGSSAPGEVGRLSGIAEPDIGIITSVGWSHLEGLGDVEGVRQEKMALLRHIRPDGLALVNTDLEATRNAMDQDGALCQGLRQNSVAITTFGLDDSATLRVTEAKSGLSGVSFSVNRGRAWRLPICGRHHAGNAVAAISVAQRLGLTGEQIAEALASFRAADKRLEVTQVAGVAVINDSYNANPSSTLAAIDLLTDCDGRRGLAIGDMLELGSHAEQQHRRIGRRTAQAGISVLVAVGKQAEDVMSGAREIRPDIRGGAFLDVEAAVGALEGWIDHVDVILVKGSRAMAMERLAAAVERAVEGRTVQRTV